MKQTSQVGGIIPHFIGEKPELFGQRKPTMVSNLGPTQTPT